MGRGGGGQRQGESLVLDEALWPEAGVEQEARRVRHPWEAFLEAMIEVPSGGPLTSTAPIGYMVLTRVDGELAGAHLDDF